LPPPEPADDGIAISVRKGLRCRVDAHPAIITIGGTLFLVKVDPGLGTAVKVIEGEVSVRGAGLVREVRVAAGEEARVEVGRDPPGPPRPGSLGSGKSSQVPLLRQLHPRLPPPPLRLPEPTATPTSTPSPPPAAPVLRVAPSALSLSAEMPAQELIIRNV